MPAEISHVPASASFQECYVPAAGGIPVRCCHTDLDHNKPSIMIALPFGIPAEVGRPAFQRLAPKFNAITWEARYILNSDLPFSGSESLTPENNVQDMLAILEALHIKVCLLIGYCSGAGVSLLAAKKHSDIFRELILVSGEYQLFKRGHASTAYQRSIDSFLPLVARSRENARSVFSTMADVAKASQDASASELHKQMNMPFTTEERLFRYARAYMAYRDFNALEIAAEVVQPTFVVTGTLDEHSSMENSQAVCGQILRSSLFIDDQGDHHSFCRGGSRILEAIAAHVGVS